MTLQPQTLRLPTAPADTVEGGLCRSLDQLLEEFDQDGLPPADMCRRLLNIKAVLLSERQPDIPVDLDGDPVYLLGYIEGVRFLYALLLPHMNAAEISLAARLSTTDAARALHEILL